MVSVVTADECVAEAAVEGEVPGPNCSQRCKAALHPAVELFPDLFAELPPELNLIVELPASLITHRRRQRYTIRFATNKMVCSCMQSVGNNVYIYRAKSV